MKRSLWFVGGVLTASVFALSIASVQAEFFPALVGRSIPELVTQSYVGIMRTLGTTQNSRTGPFVVPQKSVLAYLADADVKLERIYQACRGQGSGQTTTGNVTLSQARTCIDACVASAAYDVDFTSTGGIRFRSLNSSQFVGCVARCPSNSLNGLECSYRYLDLLGEAHPADYRIACVRDAGGSTPDCERYVQTVSDGLAACMVDPNASVCQSRCSQQAVSFSQMSQCYGRCAGTAGFADAVASLRAVQAISDRGQLDSPSDIPAVARPAPPVLPPVVPAPVPPPSPVPSPTKTSSDLWECQSACDLRKISCLKTATSGKALAMCDEDWNACYVACSK